MRTRNGRSLNDLFWRSVRRTGANRPAIALFLMGFSGSLALVPHGGTCPKSSANGRASTGIRRWTLAGLWEDIMDDLNQSGAALDALQMIDSTVVAPIIRQRAQKGDPATGFWPLKRWLHDQDPPPRQRSRPAHENRDHAGPDIRLHGVRSGHGRQSTRAERSVGRQRL